MHTTLLCINWLLHICSNLLNLQAHSKKLVPAPSSIILLKTKRLNISHGLVSSSERLDNLLSINNVEPDVADQTSVPHESTISRVMIVVRFGIISIIWIRLVKRRRSRDSPMILIRVMLEEKFKSCR